MDDSEEFPMLSPRSLAALVFSVPVLLPCCLLATVFGETADVLVERKDDAQKGKDDAQKGIEEAQKGIEEAQKGIEEAQKKAEPELDVVDPQRVEVIEEGKKNLADIQRMLDEIRNDLSSKKTGAATQAQQQKVVRKMKQLIEKIAEECQRCQGGGGSPKEQTAQNKPAQEGKQGQKKDEKPQGKERENQKQVASSRSEQEKRQREKQRREKEQQSPGKVENKEVAEGKNPDGELGKLANEIRRKGEKWGQLPPKVRDAIFSASTKPAPHEYRRIISRYYLRISERYSERK